MSKYQSFIFKSYTFESASKRLDLTYSLDDKLTFTETFVFDFDFASFDTAALDRACQLLFFIAGVSYYKAYLPKTIIVESGNIDEKLAAFLSDTYQKGLGEFFYTNRLDPNTKITFPVTAQQLQPVIHNGNGYLVGIGGGKDSLVSVEILKHQPGFSTWSLGHRSQLEPLIARIDAEHFWVSRAIDQKLLDLNKQDAMNGHVPISAILAATGVIVAILAGKRDVVVSNESSANEPTLMYQNTEINHQYSKSLDFEIKFKFNLNLIFGDSLRYYSLLRPLSELRIAELFSTSAFDKYSSVFTSCNRAFRQSESEVFWCGECAKCAFAFLILSPFVPREKLEMLFGKNLLLEPALETTYSQLLGLSGDKPLDCVGEIKESRAAMSLVEKRYPELKGKYSYDLPGDYDFRAIQTHQLPTDILPLLTDYLSSS